MFTVTPAAAEQIKLSAKQGNMEGLALRIAARYETDGSIQYAMGFADEQLDSDQLVSESGVSIVIAPTSIELLSETTLDYVEIEAGQYNFIFLNPKDSAYIPPSSVDS